MKELLGNCNFVFITLDTLRYDCAVLEFEARSLKNLAPFLGSGLGKSPGTGWEKRHAPGNFTFASHQAFFAGFLPTPASPGPHQRLFALKFAGSETTGQNTIVFDAPDIISGFCKAGYSTICIGGVGFFNKQTPLGRVLPGFFEQSHWDKSLGVTDKNSAANQIKLAVERINTLHGEKKFFLFINISAIHQPNYFYLDDSRVDSLESHRAALRYVDSCLPPLFDCLRSRGDSFCIFCSDHGTAYGEKGYTGHRAALDVIWDVPYAHFLLPGKRK